MKVILAAAAVAVPLLLGGCIHHHHPRHPHGMPPGQAKKIVVVEAAHVCVDACDHFFIDGVWYVETGHRHGHGCGHRIHNGKWIAEHAAEKDEKPGKGKGQKDKKR